jgi:hypothetical protein
MFRSKNATLMAVGELLYRSIARYAPGTLSDILNQSGLSKEDLRELL